MNQDLFFIPILQKALRQSDRKVGLVQAFEEIERISNRKGYETGARQFGHFMRECERAMTDIPSALESDAALVAESLSVELVSGAFDHDERVRRAALDFIEGHSEILGTIGKLEEQFELEVGSLIPPLTLTLQKDGRDLGQLTATDSKPLEVPRITPGHYAITLSTGQTLWEGELDERLLLWSEARPSHDLAMAAATDDEAETPSLIESLLNGAVSLKIYPGLESGRIGLEIEEAGHERW